MNQTVKRFEIPIIFALLVAGSLFLLKMAYLRIWYSTPICLAYLWAIHAFVKARYGIRIPLALFALVYLSVALDGLGNLFAWYNTKYRYVQYDEITHTAIPALTAPVVVWLLRAGLPCPGSSATAAVFIGCVSTAALTTSPPLRASDSPTATIFFSSAGPPGFPNVGSAPVRTL